MKLHAIIPKIKLIALMVLAVLAVIIVLQNTETVVTRLVFVQGFLFPWGK